MVKALGLLIAVAAIWVVAEIHTQGADAAFGGRLAAWIGSDDSGERRGSAAQRTRGAVGRAHEEHDARVDALLPE